MKTWILIFALLYACLDPLVSWQFSTKDGEYDTSAIAAMNRLTAEATGDIGFQIPTQEVVLFRRGDMTAAQRDALAAIVTADDASPVDIFGEAKR